MAARAMAVRATETTIMMRRRSQRSMRTPASGPTTENGRRVAASSLVSSQGLAPAPTSKRATWAKVIWATPSPA